jgi:hypothetical protein
MQSQTAQSKRAHIEMAHLGFSGSGKNYLAPSFAQKETSMVNGCFQGTSIKAGSLF